MTEEDKLKALGKKPPLPKKAIGDYSENAEHYRQSLLEAADELEQKCQQRYKNHKNKDNCNNGCKIAKLLRISAGVEE